MTTLADVLAETLKEIGGSHSRLGRVALAESLAEAVNAAGLAAIPLPEPTRTGTGDAEDPRATWTFGDWGHDFVEAWDDGSHWSRRTTPSLSMPLCGVYAPLIEKFSYRLAGFCRVDTTQTRRDLSKSQRCDSSCKIRSESSF